jgi:hypothetical protein
VIYLAFDGLAQRFRQRFAAGAPPLARASGRGAGGEGGGPGESGNSGDSLGLG